jgi:hypothetical protein
MKAAQKPQSANAASREAQSFDTTFASTDHALRRGAERAAEEKRPFFRRNMLKLEFLARN